MRPALLLIALSLACKLIAAESSLNVTAQQLDYYLLQAFYSSTPAQRLPLHHIGVQGQVTANGFLVTAVLENYPAHEAGLNRGDVIVSSNGEPFHEIYSFNPDAQHSATIDPINRSFTLEVIRDQQTFHVDITPVYENLFDSYRSATLASIQEFSAGNKIIGYVHFWALSRATNDLIAYQDLLQALVNTDGIILDLRNSFGFLDKHQFALFQNNDPQLQITAPAQWLEDWQQSSASLDVEPYRKPIAVLTNDYTRGAAEILAHELSRPDRVATLGTRSAGMIGDYSEVEPQGSFNYRPARETQIDGFIFEETGLTPEVEVSYPAAESRRDDPQFEAAVNLLLGII
ncbi:MAG: S41 family peptidase [Pseudomonadales bacterium]|nr:S41 family peptidase [Pseudomonadales bacterium]